VPCSRMRQRNVVGVKPRSCDRGRRKRKNGYFTFLGYAVVCSLNYRFSIHPVLHRTYLEWRGYKIAVFMSFTFFRMLKGWVHCFSMPVKKFDADPSFRFRDKREKRTL